MNQLQIALTFSLLVRFLKFLMFRKVHSLYFSLLVLIDCDYDSDYVNDYDYDSDYLSGFGQSYYKFGHFGVNERF